MKPCFEAARAALIEERERIQGELSKVDQLIAGLAELDGPPPAANGKAGRQGKKKAAPRGTKKRKAPKKQSGKRDTRGAPEADVAKAKALFMKWTPAAEIAEKVGHPVSAVYAWSSKGKWAEERGEKPKDQPLKRRPIGAVKKKDDGDSGGWMG